LREGIRKIAVAIALADLDRVPPTPLAGPVRIERSIDRHAKLVAEEPHHAWRHLARVFEERSEKPHRAKLNGAPEPHVGAAVSQYERAIRVVEMEESGQLLGGHIHRKLAVSLFLFWGKKADRHQVRSVPASTR
jgi:hypothetical protein